MLLDGAPTPEIDGLTVEVRFGPQRPHRRVWA